MVRMTTDGACVQNLGQGEGERRGMVDDKCRQEMCMEVDIDDRERYVYDRSSSSRRGGG